MVLLPTPHCKGMTELPYASAERDKLRGNLGCLTCSTSFASDPPEVENGNRGDDATPLSFATDVVQYHILQGLAVTAGAAFGHDPPSTEQCRALFVEPCEKGSNQVVQLHKGGKALSKHAHRASSGWWGECTGTTTSKNSSAEVAYRRILREASWRNVFWLPHRILAYEVRVAAGYGVRFQKDLKQCPRHGSSEDSWSLPWRESLGTKLDGGTDGRTASFERHKQHSIANTTMAVSPDSHSPHLVIGYQSVPSWPLPGSNTSDSVAPPPSSSSPHGNRPQPGALRLAILDSSFNPPSRAHYAIATHEADTYDAHLLLLSSKNVDKVPKAGDTSLEQRASMMELMAKRMVKDGCRNTAVASLAAATFAEKAPIILDYLRQHCPEVQFTLVFFIGFDTVTRLFAKRYYNDSEEQLVKTMNDFFTRDGCEVVCARRPVENVAQRDVAGQEEAELFSRPLVRKFAEMGKLRMVDIDGTKGISSTRIRNSLKEDASGKSAEAFIHPEILEFCQKNGLYSNA